MWRKTGASLWAQTAGKPASAFGLVCCAMLGCAALRCAVVYCLVLSCAVL